MNRILPLAAAVVCVLGGLQAIADVPTTQPTKAQRHHMMKECMSKKMADNSGMSKADMKQSCKDEMMKAQATDPTASVGAGGPEVPANH